MISYIYRHQFSTLTSWRTSKHLLYVFMYLLMNDGGFGSRVFHSSPTFSHGDVHSAAGSSELQAKPPHVEPTGTASVSSY